MTIKTPVAIIKARIATRKYDAMIKASQEKLAAVPQVPGVVQIYA